MISIIICSKNKDITQDLKDNIAFSCGMDFELVIIDNSKNNYTIFSAYNEGVLRSHGTILCFMHEDVRYRTKNWGPLVCEYLNNVKFNCGILGVGGSHFLSQYPSISFFDYEKNKNILYSYNYLQSDKKKDKTAHFYSMRSTPLAYTVTLDGMWLCVSKKMFEDQLICFDEKTYDNFHLYDFDICMQVKKAGKRVAVTSEIMIEHFSSGNFGKEWFRSMQLFVKKWKDYLPISDGLNLSKKEIAEIEYKSVINYIEYSLELHHELHHQIDCLRKSLSYRIGSFILYPFRWIKKFF